MRLNKREYKSNRNKTHDPRYNLYRWKQLRLKVLERDHYLCQCKECKERGLPQMANVVDHDYPVTQGGSFWDESNLRAMSTSHHQRKSASEKKKK